MAAFQTLDADRSGRLAVAVVVDLLRLLARGRDAELLGTIIEDLTHQKKQQRQVPAATSKLQQTEDALLDAHAENQALQETTEAEAASKQRSETAKAKAESAVLSKGNELTQVRAKLGGEAGAVEREAETAAKTARAEAEKKLQEVRAVLEGKRLQAEVVIPAEAERAAAALRAKGAAAATVEDGKALVRVLEATSQAWVAMGPQAKEIYVIQHLEEIVETVVKQMRSIEVGEVSILDPGDGSGLSAYAAAYPQAVASVLRSLGDTIGVDVPEVLAGKVKANSLGLRRSV